MYLIYNTNGDITSIDSGRPGDFFHFIEVFELPHEVQKNYKVIDGSLVEREVAHELQLPPIIARIQEYNINTQLAALSDDIKAGLFGDAAKSGEFMTYINSVKERYPKS